MKKKNLAEEYATARLQGRLSGNEISFSNNKVFSEEDIEAAFNAGRASIMQGMPKLKWIDALDKVEDFEEVFYEECITTTPFGEYSIRYFYYSKAYAVFLSGEKISMDFKLLNDAKLFVEKDYQNRIKRMLYEKYS
jgi:hypothetical protein